MFTDDAVTPTRLEVLIDVLRDFGRREWTRSDLIAVLQPKGLPDLTASSRQATQTITAARALDIVSEENQIIRLSTANRKRSTSEVLLQALDDRVLVSTDLEPFYAPFYSYLLNLNEGGTKSRDGEFWAIEFKRDCPRAARSENPFNKTKYTGLNRWYSYSGHGWFDSGDVFQPNPYERIRRSLNKIFVSDRKLTDEDFFLRLAGSCPELDGGDIFRQTISNYDPSRKKASLGLSHALVDLHFDGIIRLHCAEDSRGWSIEAAHPPNDGKTLRSGKVNYVEYC